MHAFTPVTLRTIWRYMHVVGLLLYMSREWTFEIVIVSSIPGNHDRYVSM